MAAAPFIAPTPAPNATVIPTGWRRARTGLPFALILVLIGVGGVVAAVAVVDGSHQPRSRGEGLVAAVVLAALGVPGGLLLVVFWRQRRTRILVDHTGLWFDKGDGRNVIPWHTLAGVGLFRSRGHKTTFHSLELYPTGPIDRDDPVLWTLVREEEPFRPGLPWLRHRLRIEAADVPLAVAAVHHYAPHLWLGESRREGGHIGRPDRAGHRERTRARGR
ncbi:hypothetical protein OG777_04015 [Micromonospora peucetia]|uniref:PH domain-containing protein n=1 Tax=Micromonospora peucetia TaxID=47871 RepID=A0A1C6U552_9ACTN|nr:hypothetical protein [Micromonospora peucetia]MCX4386093.1 hypothetical protein [Micromonospora peucetia]WSA33455.1 hypothetical protein OIE14_05195 [Micromonospora peucetia]SCL49186.1 hypothetical protein GA0070608_0491 [Micromonospora peucetia]